jgi:DNA-directed RNA polymerase specialized sigma24 family protein
VGSADEEFDQLYQAERGGLFRLALLICADRQRAEDAVADAFVRVLPWWRRGIVERPAHYLRRALVNELTSGFRRRTVARRHADRRNAHDRVDEEAPSPDLDTRVARRVGRVRVRQRRAAQVAALALVAAAVAPVAWLVSRDGGQDRSDVTAGPGERAGADPALADVVYLVPSTVPDGMKLVSAGGGLHPGMPAWDDERLFERVDAAGDHTGTVVWLSRTLRPGDPDPGAAARRRPAQEGRWCAGGGVPRR